MAIQYSSTNNFQTKLFNVTVNEYFETVFNELVSQYLLTSAKGGSGFGFEKTPILQESIIEYEDMPYHIHILNGMIPALKIYERQLQENGQINHESISTLLKVLLVGFTFHDLNKLVGKSLEDGVKEDLSQLCKKLKIENFFAKWKNWLNEISYVILCTEKRTSGFALKYGDLKDDYIQDTIKNVSRLADVFASQSNFDDVADFYHSICKIKYDFERLDEIMDLSYISISPNIYTLLSQKLLQTAQNYILSTRREDILFHLRNGFVFVGKALSKEEQEMIIDNFVNDDSTFDVESLVQINSSRSCQFGFVSYRKLTPDLLENILELGFNKRNKIKFFEILKDANTPDTKGFETIQYLIEEFDLPFSSKLVDEKSKKKPINEQKYFFPLVDNSWQKEDENKFLRLFGLSRIKYLLQNKRNVGKWKDELTEVWDSYSILSEQQTNHFKNSYSKATIAGLLKSIEILENEEDLEEYIILYKNEICKEFEKDTSPRLEEELKWFCRTFLDGNFERNFNEMMRSFEIPVKKEMCAFTGGKAYSKYEDAKTHGVNALGFNNRTFNKLSLKAKQNKISDLFSAELEIRNYLQSKSDFTSCIYYDFCEYTIHLHKENTLEVLNRISKGTDAVIDKANYRIEVKDSKTKMDFNLYNVSFENIGYNISDNVKFVLEKLEIIQQTGLRIFTTGIISPYISHNEIFVFENCLPIIKRLGWDKVRIDEIKERIKEIELLAALSKGKTKRSIVSTSLLLGYSQNVRAVFTALAQLDDKNKNQAFEKLKNSIHLLKRFRNYDMSTMKQLAEIARQMVRPKSNTASQSSRIIRDALDIVKKLYKEGYTKTEDRETYIGQICGAMEQILRSNQGDSNFVKPFAESVYDELFVKEWKMKMPNSNRLRDWVNEFAYWYKEEGWTYVRKIQINIAIRTLKEEQQEITEDAIIEWLKQSSSNDKKAIDKYENEYRTAYQTIISKS